MPLFFGNLLEGFSGSLQVCSIGHAYRYFQPEPVVWIGVVDYLAAADLRVGHNYHG